MAQALVRHLAALRIEQPDGTLQPYCAGVFAIFGHGNVTCLSEALEAVQDDLPTWRGQNEQSMALAAVGFAKAKARRQIMVAASSIGPGATNMVTAAALAHVNRLPASDDPVWLNYWALLKGGLKRLAMGLVILVLEGVVFAYLMSPAVRRLYDR